MDETPVTPDRPRRLHFGIVLLLSLLLFNAGFIISLTMTWTEHLQGFLMAIRASVFWSAAWCITALPWGLVWFVAGERSRFIARWLTALALTPSIMAFIYLTMGSILEPNDAASRFDKISGNAFPMEARNIRFHRMGVFDRSDTWYFETDPREIDRLIQGMKLEPKDFNGGITEDGIRFNSLGLQPHPGWPDFHDWPAIRAYQRHDEARNEFRSLLTDREKARAYIRISTY